MRARPTPPPHPERAEKPMFKVLMISVVIVPILLAVYAGTRRNPRRGLIQMLGLVLAYDVVYLVMLYYLRHRWVG
jgi:hypothetical protein